MAQDLKLLRIFFNKQLLTPRTGAPKNFLQKPRISNYSPQELDLLKIFFKNCAFLTFFRSLDKSEPMEALRKSQFSSFSCFLEVSSELNPVTLQGFDFERFKVIQHSTHHQIQFLNPSTSNNQAPTPPPNSQRPVANRYNPPAP